MVVHRVFYKCSLCALSLLGSIDICAPLGHGHFDVTQNCSKVQNTGMHHTMKGKTPSQNTGINHTMKGKTPS